MNFVPSAHQAAGHDGCLTAGPVFAKLTTRQEISFYAETQRQTDPEAPLGSALGHWLPAFMGTLTQGSVSDPNALQIPTDINTLDLQASDSTDLQISTDGSIVADKLSDKPSDKTSKTTDKASDKASDKEYIVLQNLYDGFSQPCILDIKLGAVLVDDTVTEEKRQRLAKVSAETTSGSLHFRVCGMKVFSGTSTEKPVELFPEMASTVDVVAADGGNYIKYNKFFGRALTKDSVAAGIAQFFPDRLPLRKQLLTRFHQRLQLIYNCLLDAEIRVKSGSLLFIYEGDPERWDSVDDEAYFAADPLVDDGVGPDDEIEEYTLSRLGFIDFAHSKYTPGEGPDENIVVGVENLIRIFDELISA